MFRCLSVSILSLALTFPAAAGRRRAAVQLFPPCQVITGTAAVTFTSDFGHTLAPSTETLGGIGYTYGLTALDEPGVLLAWHRDDLLISEDHGCSWRLVETVTGADFPPRIEPASGGRAYAWSDNRQFLVRYDSRGVTRLKPPVAFVGFAVDPVNGDHVRGGSDDGTIWESVDAGESWNPIGELEVQGAALFYRFAFDPSDLDHIVAGTLANGAFVTFDGGRTWTRSAGFGNGAVNAFNAVISPLDGDVVWVMALGANRHIFRSTDGGATFTAVVNESPQVKLINGPIMAADPADADVLFFVFGTYFQGYGSDLFRFDAASNTLTQTHSAHDDINAIAFSRYHPRVIYLGLEVESGVR